jgi:hypothetical protein
MNEMSALQLTNLFQQLGASIQITHKYILPPEYKEYRTQINRDNHNHVTSFPKIQQFIQLLYDYKIFSDDLDVYIGKNRKKKMQVNSYIVIWIPRIQRSVFINNDFGEAVYIYDGYISPEVSAIHGKKKLQRIYNGQCIYYTDKNIDQWKNR